MNRGGTGIGRDYLVGATRNFPSLNHRRGHSLTSARDAAADENLDLFSRNRRSVSVASSDPDDDKDSSSDAASSKLGRLSVHSAKVGRSGIDDLLASTDGGKHDYDWLLTPPGTPLFPSSDGSESQPTSTVPRSTSSVRSTSAMKASRLSVSQSESNHTTARPARSSSVSRSSISTSQYSNYSSNRSSSILNTSSASVSSYIRPSSPVTRSSSTARPSTPSTRSSTSRASTPSRVRTGATTTSIEKPRPIQSSRPSTPSSRPQIPANLTVPASRSNSRPSTPTRRNSAPSLSQSAVSSLSLGRALSNVRASAPTSRPSSPGPRPRPSPQPIVPPDFPMDTPPNLRTTLPDRPLSAGRSRPVASGTAKGSADSVGSTNTPRRQPSPIVTRGRASVSEPSARGRIQSHVADAPEQRRAPNSPELGTRKSVRNVNSAPDSNGFGRSISKKSLDMAIRHMDIRNGTGSLRALSNAALFPQSVRTRGRSLNTSINGNGNHQSSNGTPSENGSWTVRSPENSSVSGNGNYSGKLTEVDIYESSRYDTILLKEDLKNTNWLLSGDDKADQGLIFDNGFESLPEPFGPL